MKLLLFIFCDYKQEPCVVKQQGHSHILHK